MPAGPWRGTQLRQQDPGMEKPSKDTWGPSPLNWEGAWSGERPLLSPAACEQSQPWAFPQLDVGALQRGLVPLGV